MDAYTGEIRLFAGNYAPQNWLLCDGSLKSISTYDVLYSLLGTIYGGDGVSTFGVPDLRGRVPVHFGQQSGGTNYNLGQKGGTEMVTMGDNQIPPHTHALMGADVAGTLDVPTGNVLANTGAYLVNTTAPVVPLNGNAIQSTGNSYPHDNVMPFLVLNYIICFQGEYPQRSS